MNLPSKPTRKHTVSALLIGFIAGYVTRLSQRVEKSRETQRTRNEGFIRGVLNEIRRGE